MRALAGCLLSLLLFLGFQAAPALAAPPYPPQGVTLSGLAGTGIGSGVVAQPIALPVREFGPIAGISLSGGASVTVPLVTGVVVEPRRVQEIVRVPVGAGGASVTVPLRSPTALSTIPVLVTPSAPAVFNSTTALAAYAAREAAPVPVAVVPQPINANASTLLAPAASIASAAGTARTTAAPASSTSAQPSLATGGPVPAVPARATTTIAPASPATVAVASVPAHAAATAVVASTETTARPGRAIAAPVSPAATTAVVAPAAPAANQEIARPAETVVDVPNRPTLGEIDWQLSRSAPAVRSATPVARPTGGSVRSAADLVLKTATKSPSVVGGIALRALAATVEPATAELGRAIAPTALEMTSEPAPAAGAQAAVPPAEPLPNGASSVGAGGHGGTSFAACVNLLILLGSMMFCVRRRAANSRRPLSLNYAPPVPPG